MPHTKVPSSVLCDQADRPGTVGNVSDSYSEFCDCVSTLSVPEAVGHLLDESLELLKEPSLDELSDVCYATGRLLGSVLRRPYVGVLFDDRHKAKMRERMLEYGCVRSRRHLVNDRCPSAPPSYPLYGPVVATTWHDEGSVKFPAWTVLVDFGSHKTTYWFQTEVGAVKFLEKHNAG